MSTTLSLPYTITVTRGKRIKIPHTFVWGRDRVDITYLTFKTLFDAKFSHIDGFYEPP